jgi:hypothetical protein
VGGYLRGGSQRVATCRGSRRAGGVGGAEMTTRGAPACRSAAAELEGGCTCTRAVQRCRAAVGRDALRRVMAAFAACGRRDRYGSCMLVLVGGWAEGRDRVATALRARSMALALAL